jgi:hypothetical protein
MIRRKTKSNPTDHDLTSKLEVKKDFPPYGVKYEVYLGKRRIAFADIDRGSTEISLVQVNEGYKLRGVATFLYDYIEKDLGRKLKPSEALIEDGAAFWKARIKKSNPRDEKFLKKIEIEEKRDSPSTTSYGVYYLDNLIATFLYDKINKYMSNIVIFSDKYKRRGLATYIYDYIEKEQNIKLRPSPVLFDEGKLFWKARLKKTPNPNPKNARPPKTTKAKIKVK